MDRKTAPGNPRKTASAHPPKTAPARSLDETANIAAGQPDPAPAKPPNDAAARHPGGAADRPKRAPGGRAGTAKTGRPAAKANQPRTERGEATRRLILAAAERVIGARGFSDSSISEITREAGVAQGTFYIYFASKDEVFSELVLEMGRLLRHALSEAALREADRLAAEKAGLRAFLDFVTAHPNLYRIIQEAQFVDPAAYRAYFQSFADSYRVGLEEAQAKGEIRPGDADIRAWALMGIAKQLGERAVVWGDTTPVERIVETVDDLLMRGLKP